MTKNQNEIQPMLKTYQIFILSFFITSLLFLNSIHFNQNKFKIKLDQEKKILFDNILSKRFLEGDDTEVLSSGTEKVCKLGSEELRNYYKTGDLKEIKLENGIKCEEKDKDYMKALIGIVKSYGGDSKLRNLEEEGNREGDNSSKEKEDEELTQNIITYLKHILPVLVFAVVAILCIPGWIICCFCCCCNCCCCCCCKKPRCKVPCFIISYAMYALVVAVCIYGLAQANQIFIGVADTECSILKFMDEILDGESKEAIPKWAGINGIDRILKNLKTQINLMGTETSTNLNSALGGSQTKKQAFLSYFEKYSKYLNNENGEENEYNDFDTSSTPDLSDYKAIYPFTGRVTEDVAKGTFTFDLVGNFGRFDKETQTAEPAKSIAANWVIEYKEVCKIADSKMEVANEGFSKILVSESTKIIEPLDQGIDAIKDLNSTLDGARGEISNLIVDFSGTIDEYGKLGVKVVFGVLALIDLGIAALIFLLCFCSGKACVNCCCCRCLCKCGTHILWNILALLMIIVFIVGSLFAVIGRIGGDSMSLLSYLLSEDNLGENKETILIGGDIKKKVSICINGNGEIAEELGFDGESVNSFDDIKDAEDNINYAKREFDSKKNMYVYSELIGSIGDDGVPSSVAGQIGNRRDLKDNLYSLIRTSTGSDDKPGDFLNLGELLSQINIYAKNNHPNEKWDVSCENTYSCTEFGSVSDSDFCFHPLRCLPLNRDWVTNSPTPSKYKEMAEIISDMKTIADNAADVNKFFLKYLKVLGEHYWEFLNSYSQTLGQFSTQINKITNQLNDYTGNSGLFSFINCKFIGTNIKIILKYLKESLGVDFYTVGVCLILVGCSLVLAISSTILLIIIINIDIEQKKKMEKEKIQDYPINSEGRVVRYNN